MAKPHAMAEPHASRECTSRRHATAAPMRTIVDVFELGHTTDRKPPFRYAAYTRVGFSETDAQGVVYYGRYLPYFDLARTEYHRHLGRVALAGSDFVMRAAQVEYHAPARFDDLLEVFVRDRAHRPHERDLRPRGLPRPRRRHRRAHGHRETDARAGRRRRAATRADPGRVPRAHRGIRGGSGLTTGALEAVDRILNRGGDPTDVLRAVVGALVGRRACAWASIRFVEGTLVAGPEAGMQRPADRLEVPVVFQGKRVAELAADGCVDRAFLERVALVISASCATPPATRPSSREEIS